MTGERVFADTSGLLALLDAEDHFHASARSEWDEYELNQNELWMSDYVRLEVWSLVLKRLGTTAAGDLHDHIFPMCQVHIVGESGFEAAVGKWRIARRRQLSLVDITGFDCMRRLEIQKAFAFDKHFREEGFQTP